MSQLSLLLAKNFPRSGDCIQKGEYLYLSCWERPELLGLCGELGEFSGKNLVISGWHGEGYSILSCECERKTQNKDTTQSLQHGAAQ